MTYTFLRAYRLKALPRQFINFAYRHLPRRTDPRVVSTAEQVLSTAIGSQIQFMRVERLSEGGRRNLLLRCHTPPASGLPPSVMIKKVETKSYSPEHTDRDTLRFFNDWIGSQFLSALPSQLSHSPRFYGGDRTVGFIILEDVPHHARLVESLLGHDRTQAEQALLRYAACLGQLHADTLGKAAEFEDLFQTIAPHVKPTKATVEILRYESILERLDIHPESDWLHDLAAIEQAVNQPGDFLAYVHADACPDNVLDTGEALRLIDFETGGFGHALIDAAYGRMMFPSCWCANRLPHSIVQQMEDTYRAILSQPCPVVEDDRIFESALVKMCGFWLLQTLTRHFESALKEDSDWGISTIRQRILARLEAFIAASQEFEQLPALRGTSSRLLDLLRQRWFDSPDLPIYPALR
jgi:Phosphotransferase enzyme family